MSSTASGWRQDNGADQDWPGIRSRVIFLACMNINSWGGPECGKRRGFVPEANSPRTRIVSFPDPAVSAGDFPPFFYPLESRFLPYFFL